MTADYTGKRGGNAGDDYHELWTLRQALELLQPNTRLQEITVEGVATVDSSGRTDAWNGVDVAKYYGTDVEIEEVQLLQLKYSGSDPEQRWTVARLCSASNQKRTNSVIRRLADAWKEMETRRPDLRDGGRISAHLVSNQPVDERVLDCLQKDSADADWSRLYRSWILGHLIASMRPAGRGPSGRVGTGRASGGRAARSASARCRSAGTPAAPGEAPRRWRRSAPRGGSPSAFG